HTSSKRDWSSDVCSSDLPASSTSSASPRWLPAVCWPTSSPASPASTRSWAGSTDEFRRLEAPGIPSPTTVEQSVEQSVEQLCDRDRKIVGKGKEEDVLLC